MKSSIAECARQTVTDPDVVKHINVKVVVKQRQRLTSDEINAFSCGCETDNVEQLFVVIKGCMSEAVATYMPTDDLYCHASGDCACGAEITWDIRGNLDKARFTHERSKFDTFPKSSSDDKDAMMRDRSRSPRGAASSSSSVLFKAPPTARPKSPPWGALDLSGGPTAV